MFYDLIGVILSQGGSALMERHGPGSGSDERTQREFRQISLLMRRVGAIWGQLFLSLTQESEILDETLTKLRAPLSRAGVSLHHQLDDFTDPLEHYRLLQRELDRAVIALHEYHDEAWASDALHVLRRGLAAAAEIQGRLVDAALAA